MKNTCRQFLNSFTLVWMPQLEIQILNGSTKAVSLHICCNSHSSDSEYLIWLGVVAYAPFCRWEPLQIASGHRPSGTYWESGDLSPPPLTLVGISILFQSGGMGGGQVTATSVVPTWFENVPLGLGYCETECFLTSSILDGQIWFLFSWITDWQLQKAL